MCACMHWSHTQFPQRQRGNSLVLQTFLLTIGSSCFSFFPIFSKKLERIFQSKLARVSQCAVSVCANCRHASTCGSSPCEKAVVFRRICPGSCMHLKFRTFGPKRKSHIVHLLTQSSSAHGLNSCRWTRFTSRLLACVIRL